MGIHSVAADDGAECLSDPEAEATALIFPSQGQNADAQQPARREVDWLSALQDRLDDIGREKGEGQGAADLTHVLP